MDGSRGILGGGGIMCTCKEGTKQDMAGDFTLSICSCVGDVLGGKKSTLAAAPCVEAITAGYFWSKQVSYRIRVWLSRYSSWAR